MMTVLDSWKASFSSLVHVNLAPGFKRGLNGAIRGADANAKETWFTNPNQLRMSVMFLGVGKFWMASMDLGYGDTDVGDS